MKWSEIQCPNRCYGELNENEKNVRGAFLYSIGIDLENLPEELFESCEMYSKEGKCFSCEREEKVYIWDIAGTTHSCYSGKTWMDAFLEEHKTLSHIIQGHVTRGKYFRMMKRPINDNWTCVKLIKSKNGKYYIGSNGNHRITFYKLMYLADLANGRARTKNYWLYALVKNEL
ncbi:MAG: hypothetical protein J1F24_05770 [Oscillospiraceae bacterium]|nr:hypothetical protein [Oscillospiraceae bacterium]